MPVLVDYEINTGPQSFVISGFTTSMPECQSVTKYELAPGPGIPSAAISGLSITCTQPCLTLTVDTSIVRNFSFVIRAVDSINSRETDSDIITLRVLSAPNAFKP